MRLFTLRNINYGHTHMKQEGMYMVLRGSGA
jgi:hypothetical protein